jgi:hypothetical protein
MDRTARFALIELADSAGAAIHLAPGIGEIFTFPLVSRRDGPGPGRWTLSASCSPELPVATIAIRAMNAVLRVGVSRPYARAVSRCARPLGK